MTIKEQIEFLEEKMLGTESADYAEAYQYSCIIDTLRKLDTNDRNVQPQLFPVETKKPGMPE